MERSAAIHSAEVHKYNPLSSPSLQIGIRFEHQWKMPGLSHNAYHSTTLWQIAAHLDCRFSPKCMYFTSQDCCFLPTRGPYSFTLQTKESVIFKGGLVNNCSPTLPVRGHHGVYILSHTWKEHSPACYECVSHPCDSWARGVGFET